MGRRLKTQLPVLPSTLKPRSTTSELEKVKVKEELYRTKQEKTFNKRHRARDLTPLKSGDAVWVKDQSKEGRILSPTQYPRSYLVKTDKGILRQNRSALVSTTEEKPANPDAKTTEQPPTIQQQVPPPTERPRPSSENSPPAEGLKNTTRSGRVVRPPQHLDL